MTGGRLMFVGRRQYEMLKKLSGFPRNPSIAPLRLSSPWLLPDGRPVLAARLEDPTRSPAGGELDRRGGPGHLTPPQSAASCFVTVNVQSDARVPLPT